MRLSSYWFLGAWALMVVIAIGLGLGMAILIGKWTHEAAFAFGSGLGTVVLTFGSITLWIVALYFPTAKLERFLRSREKVSKAKTQPMRPAKRKRRKKS